jgi:hypothetical protein
MAESITKRLASVVDRNNQSSLKRLFASVLDDLTAIRTPTAGVLSGSATFDPASLATNTGATTTVSVSGAAVGDFVLASFSADLQGITLSGYVSASNTVSVRFQNGTAGTIDLASGTVRVRVLPQASFAAPAALSTTD